MRWREVILLGDIISTIKREQKAAVIVPYALDISNQKSTGHSNDGSTVLGYCRTKKNVRFQEKPLFWKHCLLSDHYTVLFVSNLTCCEE